MWFFIFHNCCLCCGFHFHKFEVAECHTHVHAPVVTTPVPQCQCGPPADIHLVWCKVAKVAILWFTWTPIFCLRFTCGYQIFLGGSFLDTKVFLGFTCGRRRIMNHLSEKKNLTVGKRFQSSLWMTWRERRFPTEFSG